MVERLLEIDQELFLKLNGLYTSLSDTLMVFASSKRAWIPFYVLLVLWMWWRKGFIDAERTAGAFLRVAIAGRNVLD